MYKKAVASFWTVEEVDLSQDMRDWEQLSGSRQRFSLPGIGPFHFAPDGGYYITGHMIDLWCDLQMTSGTSSRTCWRFSRPLTASSWRTWPSASCQVCPAPIPVTTHLPLTGSSAISSVHVTHPGGVTLSILQFTEVSTCLLCCRRAAAGGASVLRLPDRDRERAQRDVQPAAGALHPRR